jgi:hypothetical protein
MQKAVIGNQLFVMGIKGFVFNSAFLIVIVTATGGAAEALITSAIKGFVTLNTDTTHTLF